MKFTTRAERSIRRTCLTGKKPLLQWLEMVELGFRLADVPSILMNFESLDLSFCDQVEELLALFHPSDLKTLLQPKDRMSAESRWNHL